MNKLSPTPDAVKVSAIAVSSVPHQTRANFAVINVSTLAKIMKVNTQ
ncbi:hypothetical protein [Pedobacter alpinus]|uniref:Uncharacterized protein n=1 Tax=Pedobacter alpinus TaxID=1590643 RepID=A0ABW5TMW0_9SPHI